MSQLIPSTASVREFGDHDLDTVLAVAVFPDRRRMVTSLRDEMLRLWDLNTGVVLKKMEGHDAIVNALVVSQDGQLIASGDKNGEVIAWQGETGESLQPIEAHTKSVVSLDFSPDGTVLATASWDNSPQTTKLWSMKTWQRQGSQILCSGPQIHCVRYSPSGELLAIATYVNIKIYTSGTRHCIATLNGHEKCLHTSLAWTPDGTRLFSAAWGLSSVATILEWDLPTWQQVGHTWTTGHIAIEPIAINPAGTLIASISINDSHVHLWRLSDRRIIATFQHSAQVKCIKFSMDGKHILSGGEDKKILEWAVPEDPPLEGVPKEPESKAQGSDSKILVINPNARNVCIAGDLSMAEELLTQEIDADANDYTSYANRSFMMARKLDWDRALQDAIKSLSILPSLTGYISKGIALCGKENVGDSTTAFDLASTFTDSDPKTNHFLFLIKAIALFNANKHTEAMLRVKELAAGPNADPLACHVVEAYLHVQLGTIALEGKLHKEAVDHFTAVVDASANFYKSPIDSMYEGFTVLFGWDLKSLWHTAHKQLCHALIRAGRLGEALEPYRKLMDASDKTTEASLRAWFSTLKYE